MNVIKRRRKKKKKGGFFRAPFLYQMRAMNKNPKKIGRRIQRPYVNKRNRLMLGKGKKQKGGFLLHMDEIWG